MCIPVSGIASSMKPWLKFSLSRVSSSTSLFCRNRHDCDQQEFCVIVTKFPECLCWFLWVMPHQRIPQLKYMTQSLFWSDLEAPTSTWNMSSSHISSENLFFLMCVKQHQLPAVAAPTVVCRFKFAVLQTEIVLERQVLFTPKNLAPTNTKRGWSYLYTKKCYLYYSYWRKVLYI